MTQQPISKCPICGSRVRDTFSLRPENWPKGKGYLMCNAPNCSWEECLAVKEINIQDISS